MGRGVNSGGFSSKPVQWDSFSKYEFFISLKNYKLTSKDTEEQDLIIEFISKFDQMDDKEEKIKLMKSYLGKFPAKIISTDVNDIIYHHLNCLKNGPIICEQMKAMQSNHSSFYQPLSKFNQPKEIDDAKDWTKALNSY